MNASRLVAALAASVSAAASAQPVRVELDVDSTTPGIQHSITVPPGTTIVPGVAVYVYDPAGGRSLLSIGYIGAIDRGISLGHTPAPGVQGQLIAFQNASPVAPVNPASTGLVVPAFIPAFDGPEVHYLEINAPAAAPIQQAPDAPIFTVDVVLAGARPGDVFNLYLLDYVAVWQGGLGTHGAFTANGAYYLGVGGDAVPDGTPTLVGIAPDRPVPVPPAAYAVDYIDGPGRIIIDGCYADCSGDGVLTVADFGCFQGKYVLGNLYADCNASGNLTVADFGCFQTRYVLGCP